VGVVTWAVVAVALLLAWLVLVCVTRMRRLDRLHVRMDAARDGLAVALERRRSAALCCGAPAAVVAAARSAGPAERESAENVVGRVLATLDRSALPAAARHELVEAEQAVALARRVHNDAVRDTLALRSRRLVRLLHLAGTAPMPAYFDIADPAGVTGPAAATWGRADPPR
jgi:hypothetical protein